MKTTYFLLLASILSFLPNLEAPAQQVETSTDRPFLVLVQGDTANSCSFISADLLTRAADVVQSLLFVQPGDSPDAVESKMRFVPDQPLTDGRLQWTASSRGNYTNAVVNFRDNRADTRTFTMAVNYNQPNEKRCQWRVQEPLEETLGETSGEPQVPLSPLGQ